MLGIAASVGIVVVLIDTNAVVRGNGGETLIFPISLKGTSLELVEYCSYDGCFDEDGSGRQVAGIAALVIKNRGHENVSKGMIRMQVGEMRYEFVFTMVPPGATVLVPERTMMAYKDRQVVKCTGWVKTEAVDNAEKVEEAGRSLLRITNVSGENLESASIYYKAYDTQRDCYIGGITYKYTVWELPAGCSKVVPIYRYRSKNYAIVG
jgi:hypothetical protein